MPFDASDHHLLMCAFFIGIKPLTIITFTSDTVAVRMLTPTVKAPLEAWTSHSLTSSSSMTPLEPVTAQHMNLQ